MGIRVKAASLYKVAPVDDPHVFHGSTSRQRSAFPLFFFFSLDVATQESNKESKEKAKMCVVKELRKARKGLKSDGTIRAKKNSGGQTKQKNILKGNKKS